jgi:hypothetical protein
MEVGSRGFLLSTAAQELKEKGLATWNGKVQG